MSLEFEWDERKAKQNLKKHRISFEEASTVFADPLALTIPDPLHSEEEDRSVTLGESNRVRLLVVFSPNGKTGFASSAPGWRRAMRGKTMKKAVKNNLNPDMLDEYDFSKGVRGKYAKRYADGTNIVVLAPDVAVAFPDSDSVNAALRALLKFDRKRKKKTTP